MKELKFLFILGLFIPCYIIGQSSVFLENTHFKYATIYEDSVNNLYIKDTILLTSTNIPWYVSPNKQKTIIWEYPYKLDSNIKSEIYSFGWLTYDTSGFIENAKEIFIHPPRNNQYSYTEIAPFPQIAYPLEIGKTYRKFLFTGGNLGEWSNMKLVNEYKIVKQDKIKVLEKSYDVWFIKASSKSKLGKSHLNFIFSPQIGFIEMHYVFYDRKKITLQLIDYQN